MLEFRSYNREDLPACLALIREGHDTDFSEERFRWLHEQAPLGPSAIALCMDGDKVMGIYSVIRKKVCLGDRELIGGRDVDPVVHPSCRGQGVFSRLLKFGLENFTGLDFFFNFANPASARGFMANGWKQAFTLDDAVCQLGYDKAFSRNHLVYLATGSRIRNRPLRGEEITAGEARSFLTDSALQGALHAPADRLWVERSPKYLTWRYLDHPLHQYRWFLETGVDGHRHLAVVRHHPEQNRLDVVDFLGHGTEPNLGDWLPLWKKEFPGASVVVWASTPAAARRGFIQNPLAKGKGRPFLVREFPGKTMVTAAELGGPWCLTAGDLEIS